MSNSFSSFAVEMKQVVFYFLAMFLVYSCAKGPNNPESCNGDSTRRDVKITTDSASSEIDTIPIITTIDSLGSLDVIKTDGDTERLEVEKKVFTVTGTLTDLDKKMDGDWHLLLEDDNEKKIICESPNLGCDYTTDSRFLDEFVRVRNFISKNVTTLEGKTITVTGVAFVDIWHGPRKNQAENNIELHPILDISF